MAKDRPPITPGRIVRAASSLAADEREALVLSARDGLSNQEIADRLGIPAEAVERLLADAIVALDRALARQERPWWRFW